MAVGFTDFTEAIERIVAGLEKKSRVFNKEERHRVAYHEMGHALVASDLPGVDPVQKVSIIPRGVGALGYTIQRPTEDRFLLAESDLNNRVVVLMGGRAAEKLVFAGDVQPVRQTISSGRQRSPSKWSRATVWMTRLASEPMRLLNSLSYPALRQIESRSRRQPHGR